MVPEAEPGGSASARHIPRRRGDHPKVFKYARGNLKRALEIAGNTTGRTQAVRSLMDAYYARNGWAQRKQKLKVWSAIGRAAGVVNPEQLNPQGVRIIMGVLRAARYRSAESYLEAARIAFIRSGNNVSETLALEIRMAVRACRRGRGPAKQAAPLPFPALAELPWSELGTHSDGPVNPRHTLLLGAWWLCREIELSELTWQDCELTATQATLNFKSSKPDLEAMGEARAHDCMCKHIGPGFCPVHLLIEHKAAVQRVLGKHAISPAAPVFPTIAGEVVIKQGVMHTITAAAGQLGLKLITATGAARFTGHSLRATGAVFLYNHGVHMEIIKWLGRWGSAAVERYIKRAPDHQLFQKSLGRTLSLMCAGAAHPACSRATVGVSELDGYVINWATRRHKEGVLHRLRAGKLQCKWQWRRAFPGELPVLSKEQIRCAHPCEKCLPDFSPPG